jgi:hypothetical protein
MLERTDREVLMRPMSRPNRQCLLALFIFEMVGLTAVAMADPVVPSKIRTIRVGPGSAEDHGHPSALSTKGLKFHTLTVRPRFPGENRDPSGRELSAAPPPGNAASDADFHAVPTMPIRPNPAPTGDPDRHRVHTIRVPAQSAPQRDGWN